MVGVCQTVPVLVNRRNADRVRLRLDRRCADTPLVKTALRLLVLSSLVVVAVDASTESVSTVVAATPDASVVAATGSDDDPTPVVEVEEIDAAPSTTDAPTTTEPDPGVTTTTVRPPDEHETFVATIRPEISELLPVTEPEGDELVELEFRVTNPTYFGNPLVLRVTERTPDGTWLKVQIPVRPNGTEGWIRSSDAELSSHSIRARVDVTQRRVEVWDGDALIAETDAVVGKASTPTPLGTFFVNDLVEKFEGSAYGPFILSLSGFSEALETFGGGIPVIAIHGTNRPELVGGAHSNGCIRVPNEVIRSLVELVPMGTPVEIVAT